MNIVSSYGLPFVGGLLIGVAAMGLLYTQGRTAGISGIVGGGLYPRAERGDWAWRVAFLVGLIGTGIVAGFVAPELVRGQATEAWRLAIPGVLVGVGARLGGGCTSGHGVCGIGSGSLRSISATLMFIATGAITVVAARFFLSAS